MDETTFDIDTAGLAEASRRFPAVPLPHLAPHPTADVSYLAVDRGDFARTAWDEAGHL